LAAAQKDLKAGAFLSVLDGRNALPKVDSSCRLAGPPVSIKTPILLAGLRRTSDAAKLRLERNASLTKRGGGGGRRLDGQPGRSATRFSLL